MSEKEVSVDPAVLLFAFRYALQLTTSSVHSVVRALLLNWDILDKEFKRQIVYDIERCRMISVSTTNTHLAQWVKHSYPQWKVILDKAEEEEQP